MTKIFDMDSVAGALELFQMPQDDYKKASVIKAERLTPDSEAVLLVCTNTSDNFYVLYTEDYIGNLEQIKKIVEGWYECKVDKFIKPKKAKKFKETSGSRYYVRPDEEAINKWVKYAIADGFDYTFLAQISPTKSNESYWAMTRLNGTKAPTPEVQKILDQHLPPDPQRPFLETWQQKNKKD